MPLAAKVGWKGVRHACVDAFPWHLDMTRASQITRVGTLTKTARVSGQLAAWSKAAYLCEGRAYSLVLEIEFGVGWSSWSSGSGSAERRKQ